MRAIADGKPSGMLMARLDDGRVARLAGFVTAEELADEMEAWQVRFEDADADEGMDPQASLQALGYLATLEDGPFAGPVAAAASRALRTARMSGEPSPAPLP